MDAPKEAMQAENRHEHAGGFVQINGMRVVDIEKEFFTPAFRSNINESLDRKIESWKHKKKNKMNTDITYILVMTQEAFEVSTDDIKGFDRELKISMARNAFYYAANKFGFTQDEIAKFMKRERSTIVRQVMACNNDIMNDDDYKCKVETLISY